jgi:hypothetical protein
MERKMKPLKPGNKMRTVQMERKITSVTEEMMVDAHRGGMQFYWSVAAGKTTIDSDDSVEKQAIALYDTYAERTAYVAGFHGARRRAAKMN